MSRVLVESNRRMAPTIRLKCLPNNPLEGKAPRAVSLHGLGLVKRNAQVVSLFRLGENRPGRFWQFPQPRRGGSDCRPSGAESILHVSIPGAVAPGY
jgi:hypothetical protein